MASDCPRPDGHGAARAFEAPAASVIRCANGAVLQPVSGNVIPYDRLPDEAFASGLLGVGVGIEPTAGLIVAPFDGVIRFVLARGHAVGISTNGMELLIHVGVGDASSVGNAFACMVREGDAVRTGQPLLRFDRAKLRAAGLSDVVAVLLTNAGDLEGVEYGAE